ncbi:unnamed protein product [Bathycoccus prasinos]
MLSEEENYALLLSTLAGLSTSVGGVLAVWKRPDAKLLAFLLGTAIGVMATLSFVELYVKNVLENGFWGVTLSTMAGAVLYAIVEPLLPTSICLKKMVPVEPNRNKMEEDREDREEGK